MEYGSELGIKEERREEIVELLNSCLANTTDVMLQAKHAHWNVKDEAFYSLHQLFDTFAKHLRKQADRLAERAATLGGFVEGTVRAAARGSVIAEYDFDAEEGPEHIACLVSRFAAHAATLRAAIARTKSDELADPVTEHLLTELLEQVEMDLWFLESHQTEATRELARRSQPHQRGEGDGEAAEAEEETVVDDGEETRQ